MVDMASIWWSVIGLCQLVSVWLRVRKARSGHYVGAFKYLSLMKWYANIILHTNQDSKKHEEEVRFQAFYRNHKNPG